MFQRLKGAIDNRIAEEQARQRQAALSAGANRPNVRRRPLNQNGTATRLSSRLEDQNNGFADKGPDPSEFEPEFAIGEDESAVPSRVGTPKPDSKEKDNSDSVQSTKVVQGEGPQPQEAADQDQINQETSSVQHNESSESDLETRVKLRRLEKLDPKYGELLKAYRIAHAKIQTIEPFEASLREHTPLTNINDPGAFVEYINQMDLKSDMVLDELKKVTSERDELKKKCQQSEDVTSQLRTEVDELKAKIPAENTTPAIQLDTNAANIADDKSEVQEVAEPESTVRSPASTSSRIASFSLFSPRSKPTSPPLKEPSEDLFSYDSEIPRLENDLRERELEVESLKRQTQKLQDDLGVARESTEGMVQSLEEATRELHQLRDAKDNFDATKAELEKQIQTLKTSSEAHNDGMQKRQSEVDQLRSERALIEGKLQELEKQYQELDKRNGSMKQELETHSSEVRVLSEKLSQKDAINKDLEDSLAMANSADRQNSKISKSDEPNQQRITTMESIIDNLRSQLDKAEATITQLRKEIDENRTEFSSRNSTKVFGFLDQASQSNTASLENEEDVIKFLVEKFRLSKDESTLAGPKAIAETNTNPGGSSGAGKKKNKKKKKAKSAQDANDDVAVGAPVKVTEIVDEAEDVESEHRTLEHKINILTDEVNEKHKTIETLQSKLKDQEALQEEIEILRDDLLHQGEEHVEARDALKKVTGEKQALEEMNLNLQSDIAGARRAISDGSQLDSKHKELIEKFDNLMTKYQDLQNDLTVANQLAAARLKDIDDLNNRLSNTEPELRSMKSEIAESKSAKEDLRNKIGELSRLETRHENLKAELKGMGKRLGDKDDELKELQQRLQDENGARSKAEEKILNLQSEVTMAESQRQDAVNTSSGTARELAVVKEESTALRRRLHELEDQLSNHTRQVSELRDEISLKTALHSSSQTLLQSLRDQSNELSTQAREASNKAENLEEELAEAQKMLTERTRESQTMRVLLNQAETSTEARIREMKERMDSAIEERDRTEDEASVNNRRMMREVEDVKAKAREAQRLLKNLEDEKEDFIQHQREWKRKRQELEVVAERSSKEVEEVRNAMSGLREALDENERQIRELESQKADLRRATDEARDRVEKLSKANKLLTEELKVIQSTGRKNMLVGRDSGVQSSRSSIDSSRAKSPISNTKERDRTIETPTRNTTPVGTNQVAVDFVYLKNVLLQFLEQKDKSHQRQLIPVLGMLLHFDRKDEQRWLSAISTR